ncbi:MAG: hypothetical protein ABH950_04050, partial [Candidatus Altiarchaeota archaeon]
MKRVFAGPGQRNRHAMIDFEAAKAQAILDSPLPEPIALEVGRRQQRTHLNSCAISLSHLEHMRFPELVEAKILANMMSPATWQLAENIQTTDESGANPLATRTVLNNLNQIQQNSFAMEEETSIFRKWGWRSISEEEGRLGREEVQQTIRGSLEGGRALIDFVVGNYGLPAEVNEELVEGGKLLDKAAEKNRWCVYRDQMIDVSLAHGRVRKDGRGTQTCLDAVTNSAGLISASTKISPNKFVVFGSPTHYILFVNDGNGFFFQNKDFFDRKDMQKGTHPRTKLPNGEHHKRTFELNDIDRIITSYGVYMIKDGVSTIPKRELEGHLKAFTDFLGFVPDQLAQAGHVTYKKREFPQVDFSATKSADDVQRIVREMAAKHPGSVFEQALYAYRSLDVEHPEAYAMAALRDATTRKHARKVRSVGDAVDIVRGIKGNESIFNSLERQALPDEVLLFKTGSHRDKALLLYSLIHHSKGILPSEKGNLSLVYTDTASYI